MGIEDYKRARDRMTFAEYDIIESSKDESEEDVSEEADE